MRSYQWWGIKYRAEIDGADLGNFLHKIMEEIVFFQGVLQKVPIYTKCRI
jgi:hypothetical protein